MPFVATKHVKAHAYPWRVHRHTGVNAGAKQAKCDLEKGTVRNQARGGPREEERKARSEGRRKRASVCSMRSRVGWATVVNTGGAVTCTDCHSQIGQCAGAGPAASSVKADCRVSCADWGTPDVPDVT